MTVSIPESQDAEGFVKVAFVPAIAGAAPTAAEMTAGLILSCYLMPGWAGLGGTQNKGTSGRFCSKQLFQRLGRFTPEAAPLEYTYLPQELGTPGNAANEAYETLAPYTDGFLVVGYGLDAELNAPFVATDVVDFAPAQCGVQVKKSVGADEFAPLTVMQEIAVTGLVQTDKVIAA